MHIRPGAIKKDVSFKDNKEIFAMYDQQVVLKLLRLLEVFTSVALKSKQTNKFVLRVTRPMLIQALVQLFLKCRFIQHGNDYIENTRESHKIRH